MVDTDTLPIDHTARYDTSLKVHERKEIIMATAKKDRLNSSKAASAQDAATAQPPKQKLLSAEELAQELETLRKRARVVAQLRTLRENVPQDSQTAQGASLIIAEYQERVRLMGKIQTRVYIVFANANKPWYLPCADVADYMIHNKTGPGAAKGCYADVTLAENAARETAAKRG